MLYDAGYGHAHDHTVYTRLSFGKDCLEFNNCWVASLYHTSKAGAFSENNHTKS